MRQTADHRLAAPDVVGASLVESCAVLSLDLHVLHAVLNPGDGYENLAVRSGVGRESDACNQKHISLSK